MARKSGLLMALALLVLVPGGVSSLGLGEIRLNSYLNEPLNAEVAITVASPEELDSLRVAVASDEAFERFGLDRPRFLSDLAFTVEPGPAGRATLRIRSPEPVVEPFLTFLVEAEWAGGRLLREYTVLLDPPLFLPEPQAPPQPAAPTAEVPGTGVVVRPAEPAPVTAPAPAPRTTVAPPAAAGPSTYGPVRRNDTLWRIASQVRPDRSVTVNQTMLALFEANPDAFEGNINVLRAGAVLSVPGRDEIARIGRSRATAEVRRQHAEWEPGAAAGAPVPAPTVAATPAPTASPAEERLELVVPGQADPTAGAATDAGDDVAATAAQQEALNEEVLGALRALREELAETRRLIELKDAEIALLQNRLSEIEAGAVPIEVPIEAPIEAPVEAPVEAPIEAPGDVAPKSAETPAATPPAAETPAATPPPATTRPEATSSFMPPWLWAAVGLVVLLAVAALWRRRRAAGDDEPFGTFEPAPREATPVAPVAVATGAAASAGFLVEEQAAPARPLPDAGRDETPSRPEPAASAIGDYEAEAADDAALDFDAGAADDVKPAARAGGTASADYQYPFEDTIAGASGVDLDQSDPLAEADFHMAYGLYDQAADLISKSVEREPDRADLRMKLLDILFVWGKEDRFRTEARALRGLLGDEGAPEWGRVVIMGRQICPDEPLFSGDDSADVDVAVEATGADATGADALDFELGADGAAADDELLDFDLGVTGELPAVRAEGVASDRTAELEIEDLGLDLDLGDATGEVLAGLAAAGQEPELDVNLDELRPDTALNRALGDADDAATPEGPGDTAELMALTERLPDSSDDDELTEIMDGAAEPTRLAPHARSGDRTERLARLEEVDDDDATAALPKSPEGPAGGQEEGGPESSGRDIGMTGLTEMLEATAKFGEGEGIVVAETLHMPPPKEPEEDEDYTAQMEHPEFGSRRMSSVIDQPELDDDDTAEVEALDESDPSLDLDDLTAALGAEFEATAELPRAGEGSDNESALDDIFGEELETRIAPGMDVITGHDASAARAEKLEPAPPDVTLDEVGTKLDLARAYIDMGDPDGAKNILEEVLSEGNDRQRSEAQQLMDGVT